MKISVTALAALMILAGAANAQTNIRHAELESKAMIKELGSSLKSALKETIKTSGFGEAINVCKSIAPQMAGDIGAKHNAKIHRVSLKTRNSANTPDEVEKNILKRMDMDRANGKLRPFYTAVETDSAGGKNLRVMKPILTSKLCLNCHGAKSALNPDAAKAIRENYPDDMATGYDVNQVRGAFSVIYPLR